MDKAGALWLIWLTFRGEECVITEREVVANTSFLDCYNYYEEFLRSARNGALLDPAGRRPSPQSVLCFPLQGAGQPRAVLPILQGGEPQAL